ncbi:MAG: zf-TFIIB domain-containing protein [Sedimentisphaerales bacterium]
MNCPVCKNAMITLELAKVEIDYCTGCKGVWLDAGELEMLLDDKGKAKKLIHSFAKDTSSREKARRCPICDKKMEKIDVGHEKPTLLIDRCSKGDGLWFDRGELNGIIARAKLDEGNKIKQILMDMFGGK